MLLSLFTLTPDNMASTTAYIGDVFSDVKLLFFLIFGIGIGLWVVDVLVSTFTSKK
jgi:Na+/citrate or Na+/malate symporter